MTNNSATSPNGDILLEFWKEIANYLQRDVSTVMRWEKSEGLPVHRHHHLSRSSVYAYASELDAWRAHRTPAPDARPLWRRPLPSAALALVVLLALASVGSGPYIGTTVQAADGIVTRQVWAGPDVDTSGRPSPDGKYLSYVDWDTGDIAILDLATGERRRLTTQRSPSEAAGYGWSPVWSPDGKELAYSWNERQLRTVGLDGSPPQIIADHPCTPLAWFPNGSDLLTWSGRRENLTRFYRIERVALADGRVRVLRDFDHPMPRPPSVSLSPDGRYIAFDYVPQEGSERRDILVMAADGGQPGSLITHPADDRLLGWVPDGTSILFSSDRTGDRDAWLLPVADGSPAGPPRLVKKEIGDIVPLGFTRSGRYFYGRNIGGRDIYTAAMDPMSGKLLGPPERATEMWPGGTVAPEWSPDGRSLAYVKYREGRDNRIFIRSLSTGVERELPAPVARIENVPKWSPDGQTLLVVGENTPIDRGGFLVDIETGKATRVIDLGKTEVNPNAVWAPDGKTIFYSTRGFPHETGRIARLDVQTGRVANLWSHSGFLWPLWLAISPDGKQLAFTLRTKDGPGHPHLVMALPTDGGEPREIARMEQRPIAVEGLAWTPDGRYVLLVHRGRLWRVPAGGGEPEKLADFPMRPVLCLRMHPDGRRIAFTAGANQEEVWVMENFLPAAEATAR